MRVPPMRQSIRASTRRALLVQPLARSRGFASQTTPVELRYDKLMPADGNDREGPLVILHGLLGSKRNWMSLSKAFVKDLNRPVYSLDLRNHGASSHAEPMTYSSMAADVLYFCQSHSLRNVSLLGHSMGGKVAMSVALDPHLPPEVLAKLIVADIAPSTGGIHSDFESYIGAMQEIEERKVTSRKAAQEILSKYEKDPTIQAFLLTNLNTIRPGEPVTFKVPLDILERSISEIGTFPYAPGERTWNGDALFIKGAKSKHINRHNIPLIEQFFPNMILKELDAGHWVHVERSNEFKKMLVEFIHS